MGDSSGQSEVTCQVCGKSWPQDHSICPDDGTWLYEQTLIELAPRSKRSSLEAPAADSSRSPRFETNKGIQHDTGPGRRYESTSRGQRYEPQSGAISLRGATTDLIAAHLVPAAAPIEITPGMQIGEYQVEAKVGEGAMGTVYRAIHPAIGKQVAIKVMTPKVFGEAEAVKRFVGEARAVAAIEHQGIVDVFGFGRIADGRTYLVMEWLDGQSLAARMQQGEIPFQDACEIIRQIARALEAAHSKGIIHRDLKPENVFLKTSGGDDGKPLVKLLDFGLAKTTNKEEVANVAKTRSGQMLGTPLYMSPEQCKNKGVDPRTDIYALGCLCYELLCGRTPYDADNVAEIITSHLVAEPPRPTTFKPDLPPDLDELLLAMIQKEPEQRPLLGEIRRIVSMHLSRPSGAVSVAVPPDGFAHVASTPFGQAIPPSGMYPAASDTPPNVSMTDAEILRAIRRSSPPWFWLTALAALIVVLAAILVLK